MSQKGSTTLSRFLIFILNVYGLFPKSNGPAKLYWIYSYVFHFFISLVFVGFALAYIAINISDIEKTTDALYTTLTILAYLFKIFNYYYYKEQIVNFVPKLYKLQDENSPEEVELSNVLERDVSRLSYSFLFAGHLAIGTSCFKAFSKTNPEMPLVCWYPVDWQNDRTSFWIVYPYSVFCAFAIMHINITLDCFSYYLMDTIATHLVIIGRRVEQLGQNVKHDDEIEQQKFIVCVKKHQHLMDLVVEMENFLSIQFFAQICLSATVFCSGVYQMTSMSISEHLLQFLFCFLFMTCIAIEVFSYTFFGNRILTATNTLTNYTYSSIWYEMPVRYQRHVMLFMERLKRNTVLTAGKLFPLNLALFTTWGLTNNVSSSLPAS
ncbi:odorant receptor 33a-like [Bradysia coprophila]|uniref:odorant receptor 33a-like n=1 Tax=Bradysia coprophila TaxID=38358 RepID=UPI00187DC692|nr:odorant receptor 33a-like [Bradysia coprophila]